MKNELLLLNYGSPLYVYDNSILLDRCQSMKDFQERLENRLPGIQVRMHYSTKANNNHAVLNAVRNAGLNVDCMSPLELRINKECGFTKERMLYVCNNISSDEMELVHKSGVLICLDSISQVRTWGQHYPGTEIMVRINPGVSGVGHSKKVITAGKNTKFGVSVENIGKLIAVANQYNLRIIGTHQHLGSLFLNDKIPDYIAGVKSGLEIVKKYFKDVEIVDLGGGFGVPYKLNEQPLDLLSLMFELSPILKDFVQNYPSVKEFKFEPGRYIPCEAGKILGTVTAVEKRNRTWWIGTDIGMNVLVRPSMYGSYHKISFEYVKDNSNCKDVTVNICGNVCESGDILGKRRRIRRLPEVGDIVIVHNAGAYGYSMASNYTARPRPAEILNYTDEATHKRLHKVIRRRESISDMMLNQLNRPPY